MKTVVLGLIFLLVGAVVGGFLAIGFGINMGLASGFVYGTQTGVCVAAIAAGEGGLPGEGGRGAAPAIDASAEALDALIATAVARLREHAPVPPEGQERDWVQDLAGCRDLVAKLDTAPGSRGPEAPTPTAAPAGVPPTGAAPGAQPPRAD